jgi:hypothetical protein
MVILLVTVLSTMTRQGVRIVYFINLLETDDIVADGTRYLFDNEADKNTYVAF